MLCTPITINFYFPRLTSKSIFWYPIYFSLNVYLLFTFPKNNDNGDVVGSGRTRTDGCLLVFSTVENILTVFTLWFYFHKII